MRRIAIFGLVLGSSVPLLASQAAQAQATRTFVSGVGADGNPCSRSSPCQTFAGALVKTAPGGEINCLDPGGYGTVTIFQSITIDCTGTLGGILASGTTGVLLNTAASSSRCAASIIDGGPPNNPGFYGVRYLQGARLNIEDCVIYNFNGGSPGGNGIIVNNSSGAAHLHVSNTVIRNNSSASFGGGIRVFPSGTGSAHVTLQNVQLTGNFRGLDINASATTAGITILASGGTIAHNSENGINVNTAANSVRLILDGVKISNNLRGVITNGTGANTRIGSSVISYNGTALGANGGGTMQSFKNNLIEFKQQQHPDRAGHPAVNRA